MRSNGRLRKHLFNKRSVRLFGHFLFPFQHGFGHHYKKKTSRLAKNAPQCMFDWSGVLMVFGQCPNSRGAVQKVAFLKSQFLFGMIRDFAHSINHGFWTSWHSGISPRTLQKEFLDLVWNRSACASQVCEQCSHCCQQVAFKSHALSHPSTSLRQLVGSPTSKR